MNMHQQVNKCLKKLIYDFMFNNYIYCYNVTLMQMNKIKRLLTNSFMTNGQLLEVLRNKSNNVSRDTSKRDLKINLLKKKSHTSLDNSQNASPIQNVIDILNQVTKDLHQSDFRIQQAISILRCIKPTQDNSRRDFKDKLAQSQKETMLLKKIEELCKEKINLKRQLQQQRNKKKINGMNEIQSTRLQKIVMSQSQIIRKQSENNSIQNFDLRTILLAQAKFIEKNLQGNQKSKEEQNILVSGGYVNVNNTMERYNSAIFHSGNNSGQKKNKKILQEQKSYLNVNQVKYLNCQESIKSSLTYSKTDRSFQLKKEGTKYQKQNLPERKQKMNKGAMIKAIRLASETLKATDLQKYQSFQTYHRFRQNNSVIE